MTTINTAVDSGYGYALGKSSAKTAKISNYILKLSEEQVNQVASGIKEVKEDGLIIKYQEQYFAFGDLAFKLDKNVKRQPTALRINNLNHTVEILGTLGLLHKSGEFETNLQLGVPNKLRFYKDKFKESMLGKEFNFSYITKNGEHQKKVKLANVDVIEQAVAPIYNFPEEIIKKYSIISLDIGHGTGDGCLMNEGVLSTKSTDWLSIDGVKWCHEQMKTKLLTEYRDKYNMSDIEDIKVQVAIENNVFRIKGEDIDVTEINEKIFNDYTDYIVSELDSAYGDFLSRVDYIIGSGAIMDNEIFISLLTEKLAPYGVEFKKFGNPQEAITNGMFNLVSRNHEDDISKAD